MLEATGATDQQQPLAAEDNGHLSASAAANDVVHHAADGAAGAGVVSAAHAADGAADEMDDMLRALGGKSGSQLLAGSGRLKSAKHSADAAWTAMLQQQVRGHWIHTSYSVCQLYQVTVWTAGVHKLSAWPRHVGQHRTLCTHGAHRRCA